MTTFRPRPHARTRAHVRLTRGARARDPAVSPDERRIAFSMNRPSQSVLAVMDAVGSRRAVFFGVSDGGVLALLLAARHPDRVAGVVTYAAYPAFAPPESAAAEGREAAYGHSAEFLAVLAEGAEQRYVLDLLLDRIKQSRTNVEFLMQIAKSTPGE